MIDKLDNILIVFNKNKLLILKYLFECGDFLCGCDLIEKIDIPKNLLSYHIKQLEGLGYIEDVKCGTRKQYRLATSKKNKVKKILEVTELIKEKNEKRS